MKRTEYNPPRRIKASEIQVGHVLDLEGDVFADEPGDTHLNAFAYEFQVVFETAQETPGCIVIGGDGWLVGFPSDHLLTVVGKDMETDA